SPFAGGQFARNGFLCKVDEILGCLEEVNYSDAFFTADDCDPRSIRTENRSAHPWTRSRPLASRARRAPRRTGCEGRPLCLQRSGALCFWSERQSRET